MMIKFDKNISIEEQQTIKVWLNNNKLQSCQIVKIDGIDYNFVAVFENTQIVVIRVFK